MFNNNYPSRTFTEIQRCHAYFWRQLSVTLLEFRNDILVLR